jgi:RimJ/RimL family protein N-acetyltransferase
VIDFGEGITLHALTREGIQQAREWRNDPSIWKWCRQNDAISDVAHERWFERQAQDQSIKMYWIMAGEYRVGVCGLTSIDRDNRRAEFSLYISPREQGLGYARAALRTLLHHAFRNLGLHVVWGESFDGNPAIRLFLKLGFQPEGTRREFYFRDGKFIDAHLFSVTEDEWRKQWAQPLGDSSEPASATVSVLGWTAVPLEASPPGPPSPPGACL